MTLHLFHCCGSPQVQCLIGDGQLWLLFLAFSWAVLPFLYVASLLFTRPSTGVARLSMLNVFVGAFSLR